MIKKRPSLEGGRPYPARGAKLVIDPRMDTSDTEEDPHDHVSDLVERLMPLRMLVPVDLDDLPVDDVGDQRADQQRENELQHTRHGILPCLCTAISRNWLFLALN